MPEIPVYFFCEETNYTLPHKTLIRSWLKAAAKKEGYSIDCLNFIFCSDAYLLSMNQKYLEHDTLTDIITFDNSTDDQKQEKIISGDIFISYERVKENAASLGIKTFMEVRRVMVHGLLHLCGYKDKSAKDKDVMRGKEDFYLEKAIK